MSTKPGAVPAGQTAVATLVERSSWFVILRVLPEGKKVDA